MSVTWFIREQFRPIGYTGNNPKTSRFGRNANTKLYWGWLYYKELRDRMPLDSPSLHMVYQVALQCSGYKRKACPFGIPVKLNHDRWLLYGYGWRIMIISWETGLLRTHDNFLGISDGRLYFYSNPIIPLYLPTLSFNFPGFISTFAHYLVSSVR